MNIGVSTQSAELVLRRMQQTDLASALKLTQAVQWVHRLQDWQFHFQLGRGWVVCAADGALLGTAMWWPWGEHFATVGLIVVDPGQQGRGIGRQLMDAIINDAGPRVLQLVATPAGLKLYQQCGFTVCGGIEQRQGVPELSAMPVSAADITLREATAQDLPELCLLDAQATAAERSALLKAIVATGNTVIAERAGKAVGYAMARASGRGTVIGPIVSDSQPLAMALIAHHVQHGSGFIRVDVLAHAIELTAWLQGIGMPCVDQGVIMQRGQLLHPGAAATVFGLASQAFN